jgi:ABC-type molybdate transport system substrate-binding protein
MLSSHAKQLILGAASAAIFMVSSLAADAGNSSYPLSSKTANINLAVASNFYGDPSSKPPNSAITDIIKAFQAANPNWTVTVTANGATATLAANIINGNKANVDLFLAADTETPLSLYLDNFRLVSSYNSPGFSFNSPSFGSPNSSLFSFTPPLYLFNYATGVLAFLSNTLDVSCDAGGSCGYDPTDPRQKPVGIADPSLAPYGVAAQTVLTGPMYNLASPLCTSTTNGPGNSLVKQPCYQNITAALNAVLNGDVPVGFVAMSAICSNGNYPTQGKSALAYFSIEGGSKPGTIVNNYNPLTQGGIAINKRRSSAQDTELTAFVAFMTDFTTSPSPDSPMMATLKKYCYNAP